MGRVVIVTGASQGIGYETALAFARAGDTVIATSRHPEQVSAPGDVGPGSVATARLDVTDEASVAALAEDVLRRHGRVDVVVNNAGRGFTGSTEELAIEDIQRSLDVNFLGTVRMTQAFLPHMREAGGGRLIAVSSVGGVLGQPFTDAYCAAKFALEGLYESLFPVAARDSVYLSLVQPGPVASDHRNRAFISEGKPHLAEVRSRYLAMLEGTFAGAQGAEKVAAVVLLAADDPSPKLRYQTSRLVTRLVGTKLADLSGEAVTAMTSAWLTPSEVAEG